MDLHEALHTRRTVHAWLPDPVPPEALQRAFDAAHMAPCHRLTWPWRFLVLGSRTRTALVPVAVAEKARKAPVDEDQRARIHAAMTTPGAIVAVTSARHPKPDTDRENYAATATAIQNLMLSLHADGYGTKWSTGGVTRADATYALLGVVPAEAEIVGFITAGRASAIPVIPRPAVADHVRWLD